MVEDRITDGKRIAQLLASELDGREGDLAPLSVADADPDVEPAEDGARAYDVRSRRTPGDGDDRRVARAFVHPDRVRVEVSVDPEATLEAAGDLGLRARPVDADPPRTAVFVESGAETKRGADLLARVAGDAGGSNGDT